MQLIFAPINLDSFSNAELIKKKSAGLNPATKVYLLLFEKEFFKSGIMNISWIFDKFFTDSPVNSNRPNLASISKYS